jgi:CHAT domain-containing protein
LAFGKPDVVFDSKPAPLAMIDERKLRKALAAVRSGAEVFDALPNTRHEVETLAELFRSNDRPPRILLGSDASEPELDRLTASGELGRYSVIHLATHAVIDAGVPARSAVILTQTGLPDPLQQVLNNKPPFDGRLTVREIQHGWQLNAELVTLSACETALGRDAGGEGFVGFTQALLISGARSVCLSLWKVNDLATSLLMKRFYQNWLGKREGLDKRLSKVEALREAKQWLRELTDENIQHERAEVARSDVRSRPKGARPTAAHPFEHPYYWAGFILVGDPD